MAQADSTVSSHAEPHFSEPNPTNTPTATASATPSTGFYGAGPRGAPTPPSSAPLAARSSPDASLGQASTAARRVPAYTPPAPTYAQTPPPPSASYPPAVSHSYGAGYATPSVAHAAASVPTYGAQAGGHSYGSAAATPAASSASAYPRSSYPGSSYGGDQRLRLQLYAGPGGDP